MTDLNKIILQKASGEYRLDPDQQRYYMGTFRERVVLVFTSLEAVNERIQANFSAICQKLSHQYPDLSLKMASNLPNSIQIHYMQAAQTYGIPTTIVNEPDTTSPYSLIFHTERAVDLKNIAVSDHFSQLFLPKKEEHATKKSLFQKLFGR